jgi:hypothetical protein
VHLTADVIKFRPMATAKGGRDLFHLGAMGQTVTAAELI